MGALLKDLSASYDIRDSTVSHTMKKKKRPGIHIPILIAHK